MIDFDPESHAYSRHGHWKKIYGGQKNENNHD